MTNIFLESESMDHRLSNALSTVFLLSLVIFLNFDTHALKSVQKAMECMRPIYQPGFLTQKVGFIGSDEASYEDFRHGFGTPEGHTFGLWN